VDAGPSLCWKKLRGELVVAKAEPKSIFAKAKEFRHPKFDTCALFGAILEKSPSFLKKRSKRLLFLALADRYRPCLDRGAAEK
jgi:hypothetical protein